MMRRRPLRPYLFCVLAAGLALAASPAAVARPLALSNWQDRYSASSDSGNNAACQLCHVDPSGGRSWNAYGWDFLLAGEDPGRCDLNADGVVSHEEAFFCIELLNSDNDGSGWDNISEIVRSTQPGWVEGPFNDHFNDGGVSSSGNLPPADIGKLDPDGTEPPQPPPPPPTTEPDLPPGQLKRRTIVVTPGQSIQAAIDRASAGTTIYVLAGEYVETASDTNGLTITKNGIRLIGQKNKNKRVVLKNAGNQRNGISVVPEDRTECMDCHTSLVNPFPLKEGVERPGMKFQEPMMTGFEIRGFTIEGFRNGLFTENLDGFQIVDVESIDNLGYGIFPVLSKNGIITMSRATGSDDSGIWVETSEDVQVTHNLVEDNVNGFEISNSDNVTVAHNVVRRNTVGIASLLLPDIYDDRPGLTNIYMVDNHIYDNNKANTAPPGSILAEVPPGVGILQLGGDDSLIARNRVEDNSLSGIAVVGYCLIVSQLGDPRFQCGTDPDTLTPGFIEDSLAENNRVEGNLLNRNGLDPEPAFSALAADLGMATFGGGNCFVDNFSTDGTDPTEADPVFGPPLPGESNCGF